MNIPTFILFLFCITCANLFAQPAISKREIINGVYVYPDVKKKTVFYYAPGDIVLANDNFGVPLYKFFQMRYTGSQATGDQGKITYKSILEFTVQLKHLDAATIDGIINTLKLKAPKPELYPLPIKRIESGLVYALDQAGDSKATKIAGGKFEDNSENGNADELWTERMFTLSLDNASSQLLWATLEKGQTVMSLYYSFYTPGVIDSLPIVSLSSTSNLPGDLKEELDGMVEEAKKDTLKRTVLVKASATALTVDIKKATDRIKKIDLNENRIPPDYAVLDIRCYDFNNDLRKDLYAKRLEAVATGMDGKEVKQNVTFYSSSPDIYYAGLRFKYAVKMDRPLKYRVVEIKNDTAPYYGKWVEQKSWNKLIDITSQLN
ncbi:MAG TPA: hypothetical protein PLL00_13065, partial [Bacteroidia bacterium]|nr:hypothetical protein [Bacteroidia bacterium]